MTKIIAQMATMKGREASLKEAIKSLAPQVDQLNIIYNGPNGIRWQDFNLTDNVLPRYPEGAKERMYDGWKFFELDKYAELLGDCYFLIVDDDILYPPDYAQKMIEAVERYDRKAVVTCLGKIFKPSPIKSYYRDELECFKTFEECRHDQQVEVGGAGVMAFHSSTCPGLNSNYFKSMNSDIWMAKYCKENKIPIISIRKEAGWLNNAFDLNPKGTACCWDLYAGDDTELTTLVNSFL